MAMCNGNFIPATDSNDRTIRCIFVVRKVYGAALRGDLILENDKPLQCRGSQGYVITLDDLFKLLQDGKFCIRDLTDFFLVGDRFGVTYDRANERVVDYAVNVRGLRERRALSPTILPHGDTIPMPTFGYVIKEVEDGLLVWSKMDGGSLVYAPMVSICSSQLRVGVDKLRFELQFPSVGMMVKKVDYGCRGRPYFTITRYEAISAHLVDDSVTAAYFPSFRVEGSMQCFISDGGGAAMRFRSRTGMTSETNPNRPVPNIPDCIYCAPWAFLPERSATRWQENCRVCVDYKAYCVYVPPEHQGYAYGCQWIALTVKLCGDLNASRIHDRPLQLQYLKRYDDHDAKMKKYSKWNPEAARRRILAAVISGNGGGGGEFETTCQALRYFWINRRQVAPDRSDPSILSDKISEPVVVVAGGSGRRKMPNKVSTSTQTTEDMRFFQEGAAFFKEAGDCFSPEDLEEFMIRFAPSRNYFLQV